MRKILCLLSLLAIVSAGAKKEKQTRVELLTSKGRIVLRLYDETPLHRDNFIRLAREGYFNNLLFHRVIEDFMIQGGDPNSRDAAPDAHLGEGGPGYTIEAEFRFPKLYHKRGVLAAAREGDNVNPDKRSAGSQFYIVWGRTFTREEINRIAEQAERSSGGTITFPDEVKQYYMHYGGTPHLDGNYTVFGEVVKGLEVVNAIQQVPTDRNDRPLEDIKILSVSVR